MLKSQINPTAMKMVIRSMRTLRNGRVEIEIGSNQEAETLTNSIRKKKATNWKRTYKDNEKQDSKYPRRNI